MRKFTILIISFVLIAFYANSQKQVKYNYLTDKAQKIKPINSTKEDPIPIWEITFEEETPAWTFGYDVGTKSWNVTDQAGAPTGWEPEPGSYYIEYLGNYSDTGNEVDGHWAWVDIITDYPALGGEGQEVCNTWIQFDGINLSGVTYPKLTLMQLYRPLNAVATYIDFSVDGGTTWGNSIEVNEDVNSNDYAPINLELFIGDYVADESNVSIRFRWDVSDVSSVVGYAWQIDDIKIIDNPANDLKLYDARINFFEYTDYTVAGDEDRYHSSSHFGQIPAEQFSSSGALCWFNVAVENKGIDDATPVINVKVLNPNDETVFDESLTGQLLQITDKDTLDMIEVDFALGENPPIGKYTVAYSVAIDGDIADENIDDNVDTAFFYVTDHTYSRDGKDINGYAGPSMWLSHGEDGDMLGTHFTYLFEDEMITSMDIHISDRSDAGASFVARLFHISGDEWTELGASAIINVEEEYIGHFMNIEFIDDVYLTYDEGYESKSLLAAVEFYYNNGNSELYIGTDNSNNYGGWGETWKFVGEEDWGSILNFEEGVAIRLNTDYGSFPCNYDVVNGNGSLAGSQDGVAFASGDDVSTEFDLVFTATPDQDYEVKEWTVNGVVIGQTSNSITLPYLADSTEVTVEFQEVNDVEEDYFSNLNIFPNPTTGVLNIENAENANIQILNLVGEIIESVKVTNEFYSIDMSKYANGTYFVRAVVDGNVVTRKINLMR